MCLGVPGRIVAIDETNEHLASVDVAGVVRRINTALLEDEPVVVGDWVLIHVGFAMAKIDEHEAERAMAGLRLMGQGLTDEMERLLSSDIE